MIFILTTLILCLFNHVKQNVGVPNQENIRVFPTGMNAVLQKMALFFQVLNNI